MHKKPIKDHVVTFSPCASLKFHSSDDHGSDTTTLYRIG